MNTGSTLPDIEPTLAATDPRRTRGGDATFVKFRQGHRVVSMAAVIAVGVNHDGQREVLGLDLGPSEDGAIWHCVPSQPWWPADSAA